ncbi:MAG TPA: thrombospondin type 3 repeat-containing protein [Candidatus Polarisedimenticolia bacterium]|nr:thrombospondin type 3 repeat-containing protein [Candidatus Polarisedimenticolia bacterium]
MKRIVYPLLALLAASSHAAVLKVDLNSSDGRKDVLTPHWSNWAWHEGHSGSQKFGDVTVTFRAATNDVLSPILYKGLIDYGATMAADGVVVKGTAKTGVEMVISGLTPGKHTVVTYHNELRGVESGSFDVSVDGVAQLKNVRPTNRATNDYEVASAFLEVQAQAGKDVVIKFVPEKSASNSSFIINGFEIDSVNPRLKAVKPAPANDDEHWPNESPLNWTAPATATTHQVYFGTDSNAVANATPASPEFKGKLTAAAFPLPQLDQMKTYFWRVDEMDGKNGEPVKGEVWRFRTRALAFPTAEGYGRFARGGRGGRIIEVTNLKDYDAAKGEAVIPGSLRAAVEAQGPRTIIFRVSGVIHLKRSCAVHNPYCTIAGQTAPGDGICLADYSSGAYGTHDVIIRYMRFRIGDSAHKAMDGAGLGGCDDCIMDHCSISWSSDEGTSSRGAKNITFQRNIVAEALHHGPHYRASDRSKLETHAFAGSISGGIGSYHHNLLADCTDRNWSLAGGLNQSGKYAGYLDIRNNVVYNWTARTTDGGVKALNYVNNYYKPHAPNPFVKWLLKLDPINPAWGTESYYMTGNVLEGFVNENDNWSAFQNGPRVEKEVRVDHELYPSCVKTQSAREAYTNVLANVGANFPKSDVVDLHIIKDVRDGTAEYIGTRGPTYGDRPSPNFPGIIDTQADDKSAEGSPDFPWPDYKTYNVPVDSDHDGIPDAWEKAHGLNPNDPKDANADANGDGYTNLEKYLNSLVGEYSFTASK